MLRNRPARPTMPASTPSITKRINNKHDILNGLLQSDGSVSGEKLMQALEADSTKKDKFKVGEMVQVVKEYNFPRGGKMYKGSIWQIYKIHTEIYTLVLVAGVGESTINVPVEVLTSHCVRLFDEAPAKETKKGDDYYAKSAMQPLEVMQRIMTPEQFKGFLMGNCIKYRMRCDNKGQHDSDLYKARQYAYWLELVQQGKEISPSVDIVPEGYEFKLI